MAWINCERISVGYFYEGLGSPCCRVGNIHRYFHVLSKYAPVWIAEISIGWLSGSLLTNCYDSINVKICKKYHRLL